MQAFEKVLRAAGLVDFRDFIDCSAGQRICHKRGRSVHRVEIAGKGFFLKRNRLHGVEVWKSLCRGIWPDLGSLREWENLLAVEGAGIPVPRGVATGRKRIMGTEIVSFTLTEEIPRADPLDAVVRERFRERRSPAEREEWRSLLQKTAGLARKLHLLGMNHRDFYLNHLFLDDRGVLYLLDLQRLQRRERVPERYRVKDLAQLNYSALGCRNISRSDRLRFLLAYLGRDDLDGSGRVLARRIAAKTRRITRHDQKLRERRRRKGELP